MPHISPEEILQDKAAPIHIIGGGGVGMSALALLLKSMGHCVSASDQNDSFYLRQLHEAGVPCWEGSNPEKIRNCSIVFHSTAIKDFDPEIVFAKQNNIPVFSRHSLLQYITRHFFVIAVCGSHGKTTTSAWITHLFKVNGKDVNALVGGKMQNWGSNFLRGNYQINGKPLLIMEADESDNSFLSIDADIVCITNIEMDHPDHFHDIEEIYQSFRGFVEQCRSNSGKVFFSLSFDDSLLKKIAPLLLDAHCQNIQEMQINENQHSLIVRGNGMPVALKGVHNLFNASLLAQVALNFNFNEEEIARALASFQGVARRMQVVCDVFFNNRKILIIDDYAHHPTEVKAVLQSLTTYQDFEIFYFFEIHRLSRFCYFAEDFFQAFSAIDMKKLTLLEPYSAGEKVEDFPQTEQFLTKFAAARAVVLRENYNLQQWLELVESLIKLTTKNVLLLFLGAGNSSKIANQVSALITKT